MNVSHRRMFAGGFFLLAVLCIIVAPSVSHAASASFTADEVVSNVTVGTADQTAATSSTQANVPQIKATRTITVSSVPTVPLTLTVGTCIVTFTSAVSSDTDCSNNTAAIATSTDGTAAAIATRLLSITGLSDTGHGALSVTASTTSATSVVVTTTGTETSATPITTSVSTGSNFSFSTYSTTGQIPLAQVWTYTPANVEVGDTFKATINGTLITFPATAGTVANVTAGLTAAINASAQASAVTAVDGTTLITITSDTAGTAFTLTTGTTNRAGVAQQVTFTPANVELAKFTLDLDGVDYVYNTSGSTDVQQLVEGLNTQAAGDTALTCTEDDTKITCTANVAGTAFTYSTSVDGVVHHSSGGGGSSHASSSTSTNASMMAQVVALQAQLAALMAHANGGASVGTPATGFSRDLDVGTTGNDVMSLQAWLNTHGFPVAASGTGSAGHETTTFGGLTRAALAKWQASVGITPALGFFGPKTRAYLAAHP